MGLRAARNELQHRFPYRQMLCGGTSPGVALRSRDMRIRFPRKGDSCDSRHVAWPRITGGPGHPGIAWCVECLDGIGHLSP